MPVGLTDEQRILRESAERFFASSYDFATRQQRVVAGEVGFEHAHWRRLVELGWPGPPHRLRRHWEVSGSASSTAPSSCVPSARACS